MLQVSILLIGNIERPEFQGVAEFMETLGQVHYFSEAESALKALEKCEIVSNLTVIAQAFPGEFSQQAIDRLREASPLSRMIALLGSWCEGEQRSGQPWPTVIRMYWHHGLHTIRREIRLLAQGDCPSWGLPLTASDEERLLAATPTGRTGFQPAGADRKSVLHEGLIGIATSRYESFDWLSASCRHRGYATLWLRGTRYPVVEGFSAILLEGTDFRGMEFQNLREITKRYPQARRIAIMDFPRIEDHHRLRQAGAAAVLSKPFSVEDLFEELERGRGERGERATVDKINMELSKTRLSF
jgi:hypothetical protein